MYCQRKFLLSDHIKERIIAQFCEFEDKWKKNKGNHTENKETVEVQKEIDIEEIASDGTQILKDLKYLYSTSLIPLGMADEPGTSQLADSHSQKGGNVAGRPQNSSSTSSSPESGLFLDIPSYLTMYRAPSNGKNNGCPLDDREQQEYSDHRDITRMTPRSAPAHCQIAPFMPSLSNEQNITCDEKAQKKSGVIGSLKSVFFYPFSSGSKDGSYGSISPEQPQQTCDKCVEILSSPQRICSCVDTLYFQSPLVSCPRSCDSCCKSIPPPPLNPINKCSIQNTSKGPECPSSHQECPAAKKNCQKIEKLTSAPGDGNVAALLALKCALDKASTKSHQQDECSDQTGYNSTYDSVCDAIPTSKTLFFQSSCDCPTPQKPQKPPPLLAKLPHCDCMTAKLPPENISTDCGSDPHNPFQLPATATEQHPCKCKFTEEFKESTAIPVRMGFGQSDHFPCLCQPTQQTCTATDRNETIDFNGSTRKLVVSDSWEKLSNKCDQTKKPCECILSSPKLNALEPPTGKEPKCKPSIELCECILLPSKLTALTTPDQTCECPPPSEPCECVPLPPKLAALKSSKAQSQSNKKDEKKLSWNCDKPTCGQKENKFTCDCNENRSPCNQHGKKKSCNYDNKQSSGEVKKFDCEKKLSCSQEEEKVCGFDEKLPSWPCEKKACTEDQKNVACNCEISTCGETKEKKLSCGCQEISTCSCHKFTDGENSCECGEKKSGRMSFLKVLLRGECQGLPLKCKTPEPPPHAKFGYPPSFSPLDSQSQSACPSPPSDCPPPKCPAASNASVDVSKFSYWATKKLECSLQEEKCPSIKVECPQQKEKCSLKIECFSPKDNCLPPKVENQPQLEFLKEKCPPKVESQPSKENQLQLEFLKEKCPPPKVESQPSKENQPQLEFLKEKCPPLEKECPPIRENCLQRKEESLPSTETCASPKTEFPTPNENCLFKKTECPPSEDSCPPQKIESLPPKEKCPIPKFECPSSKETNQPLKTESSPPEGKCPSSKMESTPEKEKSLPEESQKKCECLECSSRCKCPSFCCCLSQSQCCKITCCCCCTLKKLTTNGNVKEKDSKIFAPTDAELCLQKEPIKEYEKYEKPIKEYEKSIKEYEKSIKEYEKPVKQESVIEDKNEEVEKPMQICCPTIIIRRELDEFEKEETVDNSSSEKKGKKSTCGDDKDGPIMVKICIH